MRTSLLSVSFLGVVLQARPQKLGCKLGSSFHESIERSKKELVSSAREVHGMISLPGPHANAQCILGAMNQNVDVAARKAQRFRDILARPLIEQPKGHHRALDAAQLGHAGS